MGKGKRYIKKSADGRFFLHIEAPEYSIDPEKKSKLWLSSPYLLEESLKQDPKNTEQTLDLDRKSTRLNSSHKHWIT